jgi:hypothetical protein
LFLNPAIGTGFQAAREHTTFVAFDVVADEVFEDAAALFPSSQAALGRNDPGA